MTRNQTPEHFSGTATSAVPVKIAPTLPRKTVIFRALVKNADTAGTDVLGVSLDGGHTFYPLSPGQEFKESFVGVTAVYVNAVSGSPDYSIILFCG